MGNVLFCGVDVDDKAFHFSLTGRDSSEIKSYACAPTAKALADRLKSVMGESQSVKVCYEAGYLGYSLCRQLRSMGIDCDIIAPSLTPQLPGKKQKTDKIDSRRLAEFFKKGLLTTIHVPDVAQEAQRDLLRSRKFLVEQMTSLKNHIHHLCRRLGRDFAKENGKKAGWTKPHVAWLTSLANDACQEEATKLNLRILLLEFSRLSESISLYDQEISLLAEKPELRKKVKALTCYRGLDTSSAMTLILELGDIKRFPHPRKVVSYSGLDIVEHSSGGKERKYRISRDGNTHIRRTVIEACQFAIRPPTLSKALKKRREGAAPEWIDIADRAMTRLHKKGTRLLFGGKARNKVKVACARELLPFIWESLRAAA